MTRLSVSITYLPIYLPNSALYVQQSTRSASRGPHSIRATISAYILHFAAKHQGLKIFTSSTNQGSAVGRDQNGIPVPGLKIPGFDRDRDSLFQIFRDPGRDRDYLPRSGIPVNPGKIPFFSLKKILYFNTVFSTQFFNTRFL